MALSVTPILGFTGIAGAAIEPTGDGNVCEDAPEQEPFTDVSDADPSAEEIECLFNTGITIGVTPTTYEPNSPVERRQMALFLIRLADTLEENEIDDEITAIPAGDGQTPFTDLGAESAEVRSAVDRLEEVGITEGVTATEFRPGVSVTRRQMAKFLVRLQDYAAGDDDITPNNPDDAFDDDNGDSGEDELNILAAEGVFEGDGQGNVNPGDDISRRQMANVLTRKLQVFFEAGDITRLFPEDDNATVTTTATDVEQGDTFTLTVAGEDIESVLVTGDCIDDQTFTPADDEGTDTTDDSFDFTIQVNNDATAGECVITVTTSFTDASGKADETDTITVTITEGPQTATDRPELTTVQFVSTTPSTGPNPGTVYRFCFDEAITGAAPDATDFRVYDSQGVPTAGSGTAQIEANGTCVLVRFVAIDTAAEVADLTVAAVNEGAVFAQDNGETNAIGDRAIGDGSETTAGQAGVTSAPDLESVSDFTSPAALTTTNVTFTFDETAFTVVSTGFHLVLVDGTVIDCTAPATAAGGDPDETVTPAETADSTIVAACDESALGRDIVAGDVARGFVDAGTVSDENPEDSTGAVILVTPGNLNPLQATQTPDAATTTPDLVSATFDPADSTVDRVTFTFDQDIFLLDATGTFFNVYDVDGVEQPGSGATRPTARTVVVTFADGDLDEAVGASVDPSAVEAATGANAGADNESDEVGVENQQVTVVTSGRTAGPDLIDVDLVESGGAPTLVFTFDENIVEPTATLVDGNFVAYLADGTRLECTIATSNVTSTPATTDDNTVTCTEFTVTGFGGTATPAQIRAIVLGAVEELAVTDSSGDQNPKGAEIVADEPAA